MTFRVNGPSGQSVHHAQSNPPQKSAAQPKKPIPMTKNNPNSNFEPRPWFHNVTVPKSESEIARSLYNVRSDFKDLQKRVDTVVPSKINDNLTIYKHFDKNGNPLYTQYLQRGEGDRQNYVRYVFTTSEGASVEIEDHGGDGADKVHYSINGSYVYSASKSDPKGDFDTFSLK